MKKICLNCGMPIKRGDEYLQCKSIIVHFRDCPQKSKTANGKRITSTIRKASVQK